MTGALLHEPNLTNARLRKVELNDAMTKAQPA